MPTKIETPIVKKKPSVKSKSYIYAIGRRKTATARVRLYQKAGDLIVNEIPANQYFPGPVSSVYFLRPFKLVGKEGQYSFSARISGSGKLAQLDALIHGLSRCLVKANPDYKTLLKHAGLMKRDPRMKESRKVGMGGKARRKKQSPKR